MKNYYAEVFRVLEETWDDYDFYGVDDLYNDDVAEPLFSSRIEGSQNIISICGSEVPPASMTTSNGDQWPDRNLAAWISVAVVLAVGLVLQ